jgi:hypothetical protein
MAKADQLTGEEKYAIAVATYADAFRELLAGPLAGSGHPVAGALLIAARARLGQDDLAALALDLRHLVASALAAHQELLETEPVTVRRLSRYRRDDPAGAAHLLDVLSCAYVLSGRLESGTPAGVNVSFYHALFHYELALDLITSFRQSGSSPAVVERLRWIVDTRFSPANGVRAQSVLTQVLRELKDFPGAPAALLPDAAQQAVDAAIDAAVDALALGAACAQDGDAETAIQAYETGYHAAIGALAGVSACGPLVETLTAVLQKAPKAETRPRAATLLHRNLTAMLTMKW